MLLLLVLTTALSIGQAYSTATITQYTPITGDLEQQSQLELRQHPSLLSLAARTGEYVQMELTTSQQTAIVQDGVVVYMDCLPWLSMFPGSSALWYVQDIDESGNPISEAILFPRTPEEFLRHERRVVGGVSNRWLNITGTLIIQGAEDPDLGNYICSACTNIGTPQEMCHNATLTLYLLGSAPELDKAPNNEPEPFSTPSRRVYRIGADFCLDRDAMFQSVTIRCAVLVGDASVGRPTPYPSPRRMWVKDGITMTDQQDFERPAFEDDFLTGDNAIFLPGLINPMAINVFFFSGNIVLDTTFFNLSNPFLAPPGVSDSNLRDVAFNQILGAYECRVGNVFGYDSAISVVRECGVPITTETTTTLNTPTISTIAGIPEEVQALCTVIAWKAPSEPNGLILSYELEFVSDQEVSTVSHQSQDLIYITTQQQRSPGTSVRVRAVTEEGAGEWSAFEAVGCDAIGLCPPPEPSTAVSTSPLTCEPCPTCEPPISRCTCAPCPTAPSCPPTVTCPTCPPVLTECPTVTPPTCPDCPVVTCPPVTPCPETPYGCPVVTCPIPTCPTTRPPECPVVTCPACPDCPTTPPTEDLSANFVGDSPIVHGDTVTFDLSLGSGVTAARCALLIGDRLKNETDCSSGHVDVSLLKARNSEYTPQVTLVTREGEMYVMDVQRNIRLGVRGRCSVHLINDGITTTSADAEGGVVSAVEWGLSAPSHAVQSQVSFTCSINGGPAVTCAPPYTIVTSGETKLTVSPSTTGGCVYSIPRDFSL